MKKFQFEGKPGPELSLHVDVLGTVAQRSCVERQTCISVTTLAVLGPMENDDWKDCSDYDDANGSDGATPKDSARECAGNRGGPRAMCWRNSTCAAGEWSDLFFSLVRAPAEKNNECGNQQCSASSTTLFLTRRASCAWCCHPHVCRYHDQLVQGPLSVAFEKQKNNSKVFDSIRIGAVADFPISKSHVLPFAPDGPNSNSRQRLFFSHIRKSVSVTHIGWRQKHRPEREAREGREEESLGAYHLNEPDAND